MFRFKPLAASTSNVMTHAPLYSGIPRFERMQLEAEYTRFRRREEAAARHAEEAPAFRCETAG